MTRETLSTDYEEFEPDIPVWPYVMLAFLLPLLPFVLTILMGNGVSLPLLIRLVYSILPLLATAYVIRNGENLGVFNVFAILQLIAEVALWALEEINGVTQYAPAFLFFMPALLPVVAYTFFQKRRHGKWLGTFLLSFLILGAFSFGVWHYGNNGVYLAYPLVMGLLVLSLVFVTRRTESTPFFVLALLVALCLLSAFFLPEVGRLISGEKVDVLDVAVKMIAENQFLWYSVSMLFVFSGLASKSSYRRRYEDVDDTFSEPPLENTNDYNDVSLEDSGWRPEPAKSERKPGYIYPPEYSRFGGEEPRREEPVPKREEEPQKPEVPRSPSYESEYRTQDQRNNDKWYEFISGGIDERPRNERPQEPREERRSYRDDRDYRRDDDRDDYRYQRRRERDDRYDDYPPRRYEDRPNPRNERDERYYDDRDRDRDRDRYERDRRRDYYDRIMDDRDYEDRRRYYDDDRDNRR